MSKPAPLTLELPQGIISNGNPSRVKSCPTPLLPIASCKSPGASPKHASIIQETINGNQVTIEVTNVDDEMIPKGAKLGEHIRFMRRVLFGQGEAEDPTKKSTKFKMETRRLLAEAQGTFFLVFFHAGIGVAQQWLSDRGVRNVINPAEFGLLYGFVILGLIFALGNISGCHINPMCSLAFALRGVFTWWRLPLYIISQFIGALLGAAFLYAIFGNTAYLGSNIPPTYSSAYIAFATEIFGTYLFITVVLSTARASKIAGASAAIAVGTCYAAVAIICSFVSTISLNPIRSLAPAIIAGSGPQWNSIWAFICGPIIGCLLAVLSDRAIVSQKGVDYRKMQNQSFGQGGFSKIIKH